jgi:hypothetical protein
MAVKVVTSIGPVCLPFQSACLVLAKKFVPATSAFVEVAFLQTNMPGAIYFS